MLSESVDSTVIEPDDRSQPQISAIFPYSGTRFPKKDGVQHEKTCKTQKGQSPTRESMPSQKGQGLTQQDKRPWKRPVLNPRRRTSFRKTQSSSKDVFAPKRAMRARGSTRLKNDAPFITQTGKWVAAGTDTFNKTHFVFHKPDLRKIGDDRSIKIGRQPAPASKTKYLPSEPPVSASRITSASDKGDSTALPRRSSRRHGKLPNP